ncbi:MAG: protoporphyrinogen/coproporphyrinogen oxidase [Acidobacteriota bacterium]
MSRTSDPGVVVVGGGLAGLSTAYHLQASRAVTLLEQADRLGGLTRSFHVDGFTFDVTGHLLHLRRAAVRALFDRILPDGMARIERRSFIHSHGVETDYPFQANLYGLPPEVVRDCLVGFIDTIKGTPADPQALAEGSFHDWALATFGRGIAEHFLFPYNRKLWCRDLHEVTAEWVSWSVPRPDLAEVIGGALGIKNRGMGYNPIFQYPIAGGIEVLPDALAAHLEGVDVRLETPVEVVDVASRCVRTASGGTVPYDALVSTMPLPVLAARASGLPADLRTAARGLAATQVINVNLGIDRADLTDKHWIYYPEDRFVFYRVGSPTAFCSASAPPGCSSLYVEVARRQVGRGDVDGLVRRVKTDLVACGLLRPADRVIAEHVVVVDPAYVVFDRHRRQAVGPLLDWFAAHGIHSIGRYGRWEYGSMEDAVHQGMEIAARLSGERARPTAKESRESWRQPAASR